MIQNLKLSQISPSKTNPRKNFDENEIAQLRDSILVHGVLQPILVRLRGDGAVDPLYYEVVAGERRYRAAKLAGKEDIPAIVRNLADVEVLEIQVIENMQRSDLHPLEEAEGYRALLLTKQYDRARIAERVGRSTRYIYDRLRLLDLTEEAQKLFLDGTITTAHAVLLSRLSHEEQNRAMDTTDARLYHPQGLFEIERQRGLSFPTIGTDDDLDGEDDALPLKVRSVRELSAWIDENVRMVPTQSDLIDLLPDTADAVQQAQSEKQKVVLITRAHFIPEEARVGDRVIFPRSWRRADGLPDTNDPQSWEDKNYKPATCDNAVMGFVAVGPGRGEAFAVCVAKKKCKVHWAAAIRESEGAARKRAKQASAPDGDQPSRGPSAKELARQAAAEARNKRINKAAAHVDSAIAAAVMKAPLKPNSVVWLCATDRSYPAFDRLVKLIGKVTTADGFVRALALEELLEDDQERVCKELGIDFEALLDKHAPVEKAKAAAPAKKKTTAKRKAEKK